MEQIYCENCGYLFIPKVSGYGEIDYVCPCCGENINYCTGSFDDIEEEFCLDNEKK